MIGNEGALHHAGGIVERQRRAHEDGEAHDADQRLHQFLEPAVSAEQHEDESEQAVQHAAPGLRESARP